MDVRRILGTLLALLMALSSVVAHGQAHQLCNDHSCPLCYPMDNASTDWDDDYIRTLYDDRIPDPIEGVWKFPNDGATVAVVKTTATTYSIHLLDSPRLGVRPGTLVGHAVVTPTDNYYDGELKPRDLGAKNKLGSQKVTFTVNDNGTLSVKPYKSGLSVSFNRWISYFLKITVVDNSNKRPKDLDGAIRVFPHRPNEKRKVCL